MLLGGHIAKRQAGIIVGGANYSIKIEFSRGHNFSSLSLGMKLLTTCDTMGEALKDVKLIRFTGNGIRRNSSAQQVALVLASTLGPGIFFCFRCSSVVIF